MESDMLIRQEEVGAEGECDISRRLREVFFWNVFKPNEVDLEPNEVLLKRHAVKGRGKQEPVCHKRHRNCTRSNEASPSMELEQECELHDPKTNGPSKYVKNLDKQAAPLMKFGMISLTFMDYWRAPDSDVCNVCGQDDHPEQFCPYNYIYGLYDRRSCKANCLPGQHMMTSMACGKFLRRVIRVNNMPPSFCTWDLLDLFKPFGPLLMCDVPMVSPEECRACGVVIFKERGDGERAIDELNGYLVGDSKLRVDWAYPFVPTGNKLFPFISMPPAGRWREKREIMSATKKMKKRISKKQPPLRGGGKRRAAGYLFPKIQRFSLSRKTRRKNVNGEQKGDFFTIDTVANNEPGNKANMKNGAIKNFWRDPDAKFCCVCGDEKQEHVELACPYNYLSPASYAPCRARLLFWQNETADVRSFGRPKGGPILDALTLRRLEFLRCFVRVNDLPKQCCPEHLVALFIRYGALRSWYVAFDSSGMCSGFGYMIFQRRTHAEEAIDMLNCYAFGDRKLRVDWAYPCS